MIVVDLSQIAISTVTANPKFSGDIESMRYMILNSLRNINSRFRKEYGDMILACDNTDVWRKKIFPYYKASRKKSRETSKLDWNMIHSNLGDILQEFRENMPYNVIKVASAEADDIIATLAKRPRNEPLLIVSGDKDFQQLQRYPNTSQWDHIGKKMVRCADPTDFLIEHIIRGDSGDGVPNVLSADDVFVVPTARQTSMNKNRYAEIYKYVSQGVMPENKQVAKFYIRNKKLIDLADIPEEIEVEVLRQLAENAVASKAKIMNYFIKNRLSKLMDNLTDF
jgi:predicted Zn-dependent protease with MMP-like domain